VGEDAVRVRRGGGHGRPDPLGPAREDVPHHRLEQLLLRAEVLVGARAGEARAAGDLGEAGRLTGLEQDRVGGVEQCALPGRPVLGDGRGGDPGHDVCPYARTDPRPGAGTDDRGRTLPTHTPSGATLRANQRQRRAPSGLIATCFPRSTRMRRPPVSAVLLVVGATVVLTGCAAYDPDEPIDQLDRVVEDVPVPDVPDPGSDEPQLGPVPGTWVCTYEPPPDDDWRDDVVCSDGAE